jgi:HAD superfamily hydrolase (TIGR01549 family)
MPIKLITFDLDNTLWENDSVIQQAEKSCYDFLSRHSSTLAKHYSPTALMELRQQLMRESPHLSAQVSKVRKLAMQQALQTAGHDPAQIANLVTQAFEVFFHARNQVTLFPHAQPLLEKLQQQYQLISITNGNSDLEKIGLSPYFSFSFSAEKIGASKPRPNLFHAALHRGNANPSETIHIGDHPQDDIFGAQQLGIHTIWFNPQRLKWEDQSNKTPPTATAGCLSEVESLIQKISGI